ncbi:helix-turn-helix domain-containing protein [Paraburkholderia aspalathi]|uniref:DNA binding domain-containing protein, excisionase family n=1 Tax=Paraburkholderia aspalathi TaxID=1324617 RepID=A0A1I7CDY8_9BURK|nr:helix-turn-helix domain-containing protein [Paraburkholderia aspalathi]SFT97623.1 DNA binding domain-containing protein, excisionase family [Paraburkholderia aspalathi]
MTKRPRDSATDKLDAELLGAARAALNDFASSLVTELRTLIVEPDVAARRDRKSLERLLEQALPSYVEKVFVKTFLDRRPSTRRRRALLTHLLTTANLRSIPGVTGKAVESCQEEPEGDDDELTSESAARLLHVSRTHLNALVNSGALGEIRRTPGGHRRISKAALLAYRKDSKNRQRDGLNKMMNASRRLGLYNEELEGVPVRRNR